MLNYGDAYTFERWHGTLLVIAVLVFGALFNIFLATRLHLVEGTILIVHMYVICQTRRRSAFPKNAFRRLLNAQTSY